MEAVRAFNNELSSLYEGKPPVSRAKMSTLTKTAIKAIKFYKHVVQSVEKFIQKCKPEYKVPGLYVIDSVVRQSRHQFGAHKDVFAPRFTKNIIITFQHLFKCPADERSKIVRVLNLWQKNEVFSSEIIQPLLDLVADPTKPSLIAAAQSAVDRVLASSGKPGGSQQQQPSGQGDGPHGQMAAENMLATQNDMLNTVTQLLQNTNTGSQSLDAQQQQLQQLQMLQQQLIQQTALMQQPSGGAPLIDANLLAQIQTLTNQLLQKTEGRTDEASGFNKKLLDFDYGESDDEEGGRHNIHGEVKTILSDQSLMKQINEVSATIQKNQQYTNELSDLERRRFLEQQQAEFDQQIAQDISGGGGFQGQPPMPEGAYPEEGEYTEDQLQDEDFRDHQQLRGREDRDRRDRRRKSRDGSRSPKRRKRSRSRSRDRRPRRSRSRDRHRRSKSKDKDREREKREKDRERKKKGIPAVRANFVTICTTTIWIGHLNKFTSEEELKTELERYGPVININMVPPRGCAYVVMENRKDANKAIDRLKGSKLKGSALKTAWAQSGSIRGSAFKDSWDLDEGAIYVPWDSMPADLTTFLDGAIIDAESLPEHLKDIPCERTKGDIEAASAPPPMGQPPPPMSSMANVMPPHMMGMMGGPGMPGMMAAGMMMRPMVPAMPPQPSMPALPPGQPPTPMMQAAPPVPSMPNIRPPMTGGIANMATSAAANSLAQTIQNIMSTTTGVLPNSPAVPPRPSGFTGTSPQVPRYSFNPNMPPPGFRMPPPGFQGALLNPMMGGPGAGGQPSEVPGGVGPRPPMGPGMNERPPLPPGPQGPKQPEMMWPPDSNEMDEDIDDDVEMGNQGPPNMNNMQSPFGRGMNRPPMGGPDMGGPRGMRPPGGFQGGMPSPVNQPWGMNNRMGGPRGMGHRGGPHNRFGGPQNMGGPRGGPPPFMPGGGRGGFQPRFNQSGNRNQGPVSLFDLPDIQPKFDRRRPNSFEEEEASYGENENYNDNDNYKGKYDEGYNDEYSEEKQDMSQEPPEEKTEEPEEQARSNVYPFNNWSVVKHGKSESKQLETDSGSDNQGRDRSRRDRSQERDRDRDFGRDRGRDRPDSRDRDRDRRRSRDSSRDGDRRHRDDSRGGRRDDRERSRKSRWGDALEITEPADTANNIDKEMSVNEAATDNKTGNTVTESTNVETTINESESNINDTQNESVSNTTNDKQNTQKEGTVDAEAPLNDIVNEPVTNDTGEPVAKTDTEAEPPNIEHQRNVEPEPSQQSEEAFQSNGTSQSIETEAQSTETQEAVNSEPSVGSETIGKNTESVVQKEPKLDLEEGELSS
ncbi:SCAF4-like protein [Mya arenaria]|uniref:SCAF4-like protein n=1 Tax=Mya arenaria TaxID=6604 RepID=A0ABY7EE68_MYAAR|nr:SR-related and CTD-associated factor 4-like [Mya arenaria]WAR07345.1 SCAF4-like protein [Mya arenaria]